MEQEQAEMKNVHKLALHILEKRHKQYDSYLEGDIREYTSGLLVKAFRVIRMCGYILLGQKDKFNPDTVLDLLNYCGILLAKDENYKQHKNWKDAEK